MSYGAKTRVAILRGGPSDEYAVSLRTGQSVLEQLSDPFHAIDIFIDRNGRWHFHGKREEPDTILGKVDVVWNALHGGYGENGQVQHLLESHGVPFSGSGKFASAISMNKILAKRMLEKVGIKTPYYRIIRKEDVSDIASLAENLYRTFPQPVIIKPVASGSSLGVSKAQMPDEIGYALELAFRNSDSVLIEEYIAGTEAVGAVVEGFRGSELYPLLPVEIILPSGAPFFDYHSKYSGGARLVAPGNFSTETKKALQNAAQLVHRTLGLRHYSSADFIVHPKRGIYFLEADSLPPLSSDSPFAAALGAVGSSLSEFLSSLILLALQRK